MMDRRAVATRRLRAREAHGPLRRAATTLGCLLVALFAAAGTGHARPLRVVVTVPDLGSLAGEVGGVEVEVDALVHGPQDAHFVEARPSYIRKLSKADLFAYVGLALEAAWLPPLVGNARNTRVLPGQPGNFDASVDIPRRGMLGGEVDRSMGDVHPFGSPHYLLDPINGLRVARRMQERFAELRPERADYFASRYAEFERRLFDALVGKAMGAALSYRALAEAALQNRLEALIASASAGPDGVALGGWLGAMAPHAGARSVADHDLWPYFAARFGFEVIDFLEPKPGVTPTTRHLAEVAETMQKDGIRAILSAPYFSTRYAAKVSQATGATVVEMAHQVGARKGAEDYLSMVDWNVRHLAAAF